MREKRDLRGIPQILPV
uniref:Uncharacterized protein n=1 Tax=Anguilla anguilla TaxID=7936 RepID=A0A0E9W063_ANGAN